MRILLTIVVLALAVRLAGYALIALVIILLVMRPRETIALFGLLLFFGLLAQAPLVGLALLGGGVLLARRAA